MTRYYMDADGNQLGGYDGPESSIPKRFQGMFWTDIPPEHGKQTWLGDRWSDAAEIEDEPDDLAVRLAVLEEKVGVTDAEKTAKKEDMKRAARGRRGRGAGPSRP